MAALLAATILAPFVVLLVWSRVRQRYEKRYVLIAIGERRHLSTRPRLITTEEELALLQQVGETIQGAGLGTAKVLMFQQRSTMDLVLEADDPKALAAQLAPLLAAFPVKVSPVGRRGDLTWVAKLWRHL